jgi:two-component system phosphate regulon response regulator PhoB
MPGSVSGVDLCRRLKLDEISLREFQWLCSARGTERDHKVQGLDAGADDTLTKPFSTRELVSVKAVLRRPRNSVVKKSVVWLKSL